MALIMADENFSLRDIVKYGLITLGYAANPEILRITEDLAFYSWSLLVLSAALADIHLERVIRVGVKTLLDLKGPKTWSGELSLMALAKEDGYMLTNYPGSTGNPTIAIRTGFFTASLANCWLLGIEPCAIMDHNAVSPFVRTTQNTLGEKHGYHVPDLNQIMETQEDISRDFTHNMHPTLEQLTIPHHPYLDIIPWPSFRSQAIIASSTNPPLIDKNELCLDLLSDGIYCCSVPGVSLHGRGEGTPWDSRSWEAKPWFLHKWSLLVGHDVQQTSSWWRLQSRN